jgi:hypothetical protein
MILRHMNEQRAVESRTVRAGDGRSRNVVIRDQFIIEDCKHSVLTQPYPKTSNTRTFLMRAVDETHLLVKTDMLDEIKAEFQAQVRRPILSL